MHARAFLKHYRFDDRMINGRFYPDDAIKVESGDTVGVVLTNLGGPEKLEDIEPFLYNLFMDPAIIDMPFGGVLRHWLSRFISSKRSAKVAKDYAAIGGGSPLLRLTQEQAENLEMALNRDFGKQTGINFRVYIAMRYWNPTTEDAVARMKQDGVNKVVLLPLYPHYSKTTTGAALVYWWTLEQEKEIPAWPTAYVYEYAAHPGFVAAINARIDEGLELFKGIARANVQLLFSAHGTPLFEMKKRRDPYCCLIHATVEHVMKLRGGDLPFHVSFQSKVGPAEWLTPSTPDKLKELAEAGCRSVLVIPVAFVTDHIETAYELDIQIRAEAEASGIENYGVTAGLNSHPSFIEALADAVVSKIDLPNGQNRRLAPSGIAAVVERTCRCHQCENISEALRWQEQTKQAGIHRGTLS